MDHARLSHLTPGLTPARTAEASDRPSDEAQRASVRALAQQFESMLLAQMLRDMRGADDEDEAMRGFGNATMSDVMHGEVAGALSRAGGIGLADVIADAFARSEGVGTAPVTEAAVANASVLPSVLAVPPHAVPAGASQRRAMTLELPGAPVTSDFGWRADPITGRQRFHAGTDLRMAYGEEVQAAASGTVTAIDEGSGYGLMVTVSHEGGLETRYAHLSAADVRIGQRVAAGETIARSGNSGRSTGPHLHFEVREHGRALDPDQFSERLTAAAADDAR